MYLIDTNIFVELLLKQEKSKQVEDFLKQVSSTQLYSSDFSLHSIGVILWRAKKQDLYLKFITDLFGEPSAHMVKLEHTDSPLIIKNTKEFNLDFDDAYQYTLAEKHDLTLVSFDKDFDKTKRGRKTPAEILKF